MVTAGSDAPTWDLEGLCPGGVGGPRFAETTSGIERRIAALAERLSGLLPPRDDAGRRVWAETLLALEAIEDDAGELTSLASCATATDARSAAAAAAMARADEIDRQRRLAGVAVTAAIDALDDGAFEALVAWPELGELAPRLRRLRHSRHLRLPPELQALKLAMDREALTGWGRLYDRVAGDLTGELHLDGETRRLGVAELTAMRAHPDGAVRRAAFTAASAAWRSVSTVCAHTLTQIVGARQQHQDRLGVDELASTLSENRIDRATLDAMEAATDAARPALTRYLAHKARLLGKERIDYCDLDAPVGVNEEQWSWTETTRAIGEAFGAFHPRFADFAAEALSRRWVDARPGEGRTMGGFCTPFPRSQQSRIFMTYTGTLDNATTLAHELGHAYHNKVLAGKSASRADFTSSLAETASTFAEAVFRDHVLERATDPALRAFMLDQQLQAAASFLMDIPHRFRFERRLYALRRQGVFDADQLSAEIEAIQDAAWAGALGEKNPTFWCSKLHFYIPEIAFYNWPYQFGYLFSGAVHARAKAEGPSFLAALDELLVRTGWQDTPELAQETLGIDVRSPAFWRATVAPVLGWVDAFIATTGA